MVTVLVNGRKCELSWSEFEALLARTMVNNPVEVIDVTGGAYVTA